ncbi:extensin family protein [Aquamicrobium sp. LC103]|uniref:extensin-like domain-containing protein n=1 Tax=Aquamicrobium sp. LC103 TaxID=1120658 RepID=UPI00063E9DDB|nr:extensin family protein [Aquamicrobium sp. LC103]TKT80389.1 extensin family protein [Aquamicrobium sp. LC103]
MTIRSRSAFAAFSPLFIVLGLLAEASFALAQSPELPAEMAAPDLLRPMAEEKAGKLDDGATPPTPTARPGEPEGGKAGEKPADAGKEKTEPKTAAKPSDEEIACRKRLSDLGVEFTPHPPLADASGCSAPFPLTVTALSEKVEIRPEAVMNCRMAEATARFMRDVASPEAENIFGAPIVALNHASAYVCRSRNGQTKLSEHAFANALDWASVELANGEVITIARQPLSEQKNSKFQSRIRRAACGPFKTVLGPGSDADHADHFHFDLAQRRNGGTYCR